MWVGEGVMRAFIICNHRQILLGSNERRYAWVVTCIQTSVCELEGKRQHGSKRHRWEDNIKI
jgi:hypothetical protein